MGFELLIVRVLLGVGEGRGSLAFGGPRRRFRRGELSAVTLPLRSFIIRSPGNIQGNPLALSPLTLHSEQGRPPRKIKDNPLPLSPLTLTLIKGKGSQGVVRIRNAMEDSAWRARPAFGGMTPIPNTTSKASWGCWFLIWWVRDKINIVVGES